MSGRHFFVNNPASPGLLSKTDKVMVTVMVMVMVIIVMMVLIGPFGVFFVVVFVTGETYRKFCNFCCGVVLVYVVP